jgi:hypothetical protein
MSRNRRDVRCGFCSAPGNGRTDLALQNSSFAYRKIDSQSVSVLGLTARTWALQNCLSLILKTKRDPEGGWLGSNNSFIFNNLAERVGFETDFKRQIKDLVRHGQQSWCM